MRSTLSALLLSAAGLLALPAQAAPTKQALRYPSLTPDGKQVVFCYRGDIWIAPADGKGQTLRLTLHEAQETLPRVSPDGKLVAFCSRRNGNYDIFTVPVSGGVPKQITFHGGGELTCEWSPDGKKILFVSGQAVGNWGMDLWEVDLKGGNPRRVTFDGGRDACYSPDGSKIVYARGFNTIYWDDYEGSANYDLYVADLAGGLPRRLTRTEGNERYPFFSKDGKTIYFVAEEKGVANFYAMPFEGGKRVQLTKYDGSDVHRPDMGWDLKTVVFELVGQLYTVDLTAPAEKPTPLKITVRSDVRNRARTDTRWSSPCAGTSGPCPPRVARGRRSRRDRTTTSGPGSARTGRRSPTTRTQPATTTSSSMTGRPRRPARSPRTRPAISSTTGRRTGASWSSPPSGAGTGTSGSWTWNPARPRSSRATPRETTIPPSPPTAVSSPSTARGRARRRSTS
jgi:Tol biopolymer transport system component